MKDMGRNQDKIPLFDFIGIKIYGISGTSLLDQGYFGLFMPVDRKNGFIGEGAPIVFEGEQDIPVVFVLLKIIDCFVLSVHAVTPCDNLYRAFCAAVEF
jgi:hypothetical protein